ncbi:MAG: pyrroline-5-carboxylate reductase [Oceanospirillaceae bacterium]|nr:pyrroline-5-carboxylate reductase [Oceanospirillaceae bacterium]
MSKIAFIGGGNMATAIIGGLVSGGETQPDLIHVSDPNQAQLDELSEKTGVSTTTDNLAAITSADVVILAVKPQVMKDVLQPLKATLEEQQPLLVSIAAGISLASMEKWSGCQNRVRCMPNTPALLGEGATGLVASDSVTLDQKNQADQLLEATGITVWLQDETEIDAVTALSGSGPAYYFLLMESMIAAGQKLGLTEETARQLTLKTALGAGRMAFEADVGPAELRRRVTSPGGTTQRAIETFQDGEMPELVEKAMTAARDRAVELNILLSDAD